MNPIRVAVFVKQVPDLRSGSVGTKPDGTIDRAAASAITNPADLHAVEAALQIGDEVVAVSMGPPAAEATLRDAIAHGATSGVLVTDRLFAGSDTWATANVLSAAVEALGSFDLYLCGISAIDGETGNVGPQIAERLDVPHATGCEAIKVIDGRIQVRRVVEGGYEVLSLPLPAVVTIAETGFTPRYPTLPLRRTATAAEIRRLTAADLALSEDRAGLTASPTKVAHMEQVRLPQVSTRYVGVDLDYNELAAVLSDIVDSAAGQASITKKTQEAIDAPVSLEREPVDGPVPVWVICEAADGHLAHVTAELLTKAQSLAESLGGGVGAFVAGSDVPQLVEEAAHYGADLILLADDPRLAAYRSLTYARVVSDAILKHGPEIVLLGGTSTGRDLAPRIAARLDTGLAADCTDLEIADWSRRGTTFPQLLHQVRPAMASSVLATCICPEARPQIATIRPGVFSTVPNPKSPRIENVTVDLLEQDLVVEVVERSVQKSSLPLSEASIVVAGGAGCSSENWHMVEDLAGALGGNVGASRAAVDAGLASRSIQVGQTGATIKPALYVACGISGAFQHVVGMQAAATIVAINRDAEAAIFEFAHYGIVGDVTDVLPQLSTSLMASR